MIKRLAITMLVVFSYFTASAQIATPLLDRTMKVQSSAAAGWRDNSTVGINAVNAEGKVTVGTTEIGDVTIGGSIPAVLAALKTEALAIELYMSTDTTKKTKLKYIDSQSIDLDGPGPSPATPVAIGVEYELEQKLPETRLNLSYVFGDALSVGLGYRVEETKSESTNTFAAINPAIPISGSSIGDGKETETGLMVSASLKLGDIFYVAGGMENVDIKTSSSGGDLVDNAWSNTIIGLGLLVGKPGESRFRMEYAIVQSPESKKDIDTVAGKGAHTHYKTDFNSMSLEALFGNFLLSYISETKKEADTMSQLLKAEADTKTVTTQMGIGWMPEEGLTVSAYMFNIKLTETAELDELNSEPKGWRLNVGWNF